MKEYEKNIRKVEPYVPGEQPREKVIKLNTNENPYPPAPGVRAALKEMDTDMLRLLHFPYSNPPLQDGNLCRAWGIHRVELINEYDNLIVVKTFSKARSMAGMRIGYALGSPALIRYLNDAKYSFNSYTM